MITNTVALRLEVCPDGRVLLEFTTDACEPDALTSPHGLDMPATRAAEAICNAVSGDLQPRLRSICEEARQRLRPHPVTY